MCRMSITIGQNKDGEHMDRIKGQLTEMFPFSELMHLFRLFPPMVGNDRRDLQNRLLLILLGAFAAQRLYLGKQVFDTILGFKLKR